MSLAIKRSIQPIISCRIEPGGLLVFTLSAPHRFGVEPFLAEMVSKHLLPGVRFQLERFRLSCCDGFLEGDVAVQLKEWHIDRVKRSLDLFTHELGLGIASSFYSTKLLEMGGSDKRALVHEHLSRLIHRFPTHFDYDLLSLAQHLFLAVSEPFRDERSVRHLARIATSLYMVNKEIGSDTAHKRVVSMRCGKAALQEPLQRRHVTTVALGVRTLSEHEVITEKHVCDAIKSVAAHAKIIPESLFRRDAIGCKGHIFYVEVEVEPAALRGLPEAVSRRIERLVPQIVMPRNEEEVIRGLLTLGKQITYVRDLPQVIISFEKQTEESLTFTVIVARLVVGDTASWSELFQATAFAMENHHDLGQLRQKYDKEGAVLTVSLPVAPYMKGGGEVDLLAAREDVVARLEAILGEFRDYNGGMLSKEAEQLARLKAGCNPDDQERAHHFFRSIQPTHIRAAVAPELLIAVFSAILKGPTATEWGPYAITVTTTATSFEGCLLFGYLDTYCFFVK